MNSRRVYTIVGIVVAVGFLLSLVAGAVAGGVVGYFAGREQARAIVRSEVDSALSQLDERSVSPRQLLPEQDQVTPFARPPFEMLRPGAVLVEVIADSPAEKAGLQPGDVILKVNDESVSLAMELSQIIAKYEPGDAVTLTYVRDGEEQTVDVTLGSNPDRPDSPYLGVTYRTYMQFEQPR